VGTADREIFVFGEAEPLTPFGALARSDGDASSAPSLSSRNARLSGPMATIIRNTFSRSQIRFGRRSRILRTFPRVG